MNPKSEAEAVAQYRPFVIKTAGRFKTSVPKEDLIQEGLIAVAVAFRQWRQDGGASFLTWINRPVYYAMLKLVREQNRAGGSFKGGPRGEELARRVIMYSFDDYWRSGEGRPVQDDEMDHGIVPEEDENRLSLGEQISSDDDPPDLGVALKQLPALLTKLGAKERQVLRLRFDKELTYQQVGEKIGVSREAARQIEQRAIARLRELMKVEDDS